MLKIFNKYSLTHAFFLVLLPILYFLPILPPPRSFFFFRTFSLSSSFYTHPFSLPYFLVPLLLLIISSFLFPIINFFSHHFSSSSLLHLPISPQIIIHFFLNPPYRLSHSTPSISSIFILFFYSYFLIPHFFTSSLIPHSSFSSFLLYTFPPMLPHLLPYFSFFNFFFVFFIHLPHFYPLFSPLLSFPSFLLHALL